MEPNLIQPDSFRLGYPGLGVCPQSPAEAEAEALQQTDPCGRLPHPGTSQTGLEASQL